MVRLASPGPINTAQVSADVAKEAGRTAEVGYDTETSQDISIWQGFSGYEATVGERCGVGMQECTMHELLSHHSKCY